MEKLYKLEYYVPESHLEATKQALFTAGAGKIGDYDCCAFQSSGQGQFRPLPGSSPYLGETLKVEAVAEYKVEMVCRESCIKQAVAALKESHPYETPAYCCFEVSC